MAGIQDAERHRLEHISGFSSFQVFDSGACVVILVHRHDVLGQSHWFERACQALTYGRASRGLGFVLWSLEPSGVLGQRCSACAVQNVRAFRRAAVAAGRSAARGRVRSECF